MSLCGAPSPWETTCTLPEDLKHYEHLDARDKAWANDEFPAPPPRGRGKGLDRVREIAAATRKETTARFATPIAIETASGPTEPPTHTAAGRVLAHLRTANGRWVDGEELVRPHVGGINGTRRARELRQAGHPIDIEPDPNDAHRWLYRYRIS